MKHILFLLFSIIVCFNINAKTKVKVKYDYSENGVHCTALSGLPLVKFMQGSGATLIGFNENDSIYYYLEIADPPFSKGHVDENLIVKLDNDSIVELPFIRIEEERSGSVSTTTYNRFFKSYNTYTSNYKYTYKRNNFGITEDLMKILTKNNIVKIRLIRKGEFVDYDIHKNCLTEYLREGSKLIKEKQSSYNRYEGF